MSNTLINWKIGKLYKRRSGIISKMVACSSIEYGHGYIIKFDYGTDVWRNNGRVIYTSDSDHDIIEEIKESEMKIEVGKWYKTREGYKAFVSHKIIDGVVATCPYGGYVIDQFNQAVLWCWCENGTDSRDGEMHEYDLIEEWKEPKSGVKYFNIYQDNSGRIWEGGLSDLETVKRWAEEQTRSKTHDTILARVRVEWKEGQFDD